MLLVAGMKPPRARIPRVLPKSKAVERCKSDSQPAQGKWSTGQTTRAQHGGPCDVLGCAVRELGFSTSMSTLGEMTEKHDEIVNTDGPTAVEVIHVEHEPKFCFDALEHQAGSHGQFHEVRHFFGAIGLCVIVSELTPVSRDLPHDEWRRRRRRRPSTGAIAGGRQKRHATKKRRASFKVSSPQSTASPNLTAAVGDGAYSEEKTQRTNRWNG